MSAFERLQRRIARRLLNEKEEELQKVKSALEEAKNALAEAESELEKVEGGLVKAEGQLEGKTKKLEKTNENLQGIKHERYKEFHKAKRYEFSLKKKEDNITELKNQLKEKTEELERMQNDRTGNKLMRLQNQLKLKTEELEKAKDDLAKTEDKLAEEAGEWDKTQRKLAKVEKKSEEKLEELKKAREGLKEAMRKQKEAERRFENKQCEAKSYRESLDKHGIHPGRGKPTLWEEFAEWVEREHGYYIKLTPAARRSINKAQYEDVGAAADCIEYLAESAMKAKQLRNRRIFKSFRITLCGKDEYDFEYEGKIYTAKWHIKGGSIKDPRYCLRIYFAWDKKNKRCIIDHMPSHR